MIRYKGVVPFTKYTLRGYPFTAYREEPLVPRIDEKFLDCSVYLYPTEDAATRGERIGGSGFLVAVPAFGGSWLLDGRCPRNDLFHLYVVTNRHVIRQPRCDFAPNPMVRLNNDAGKFDVIPAEIEDWTCSEHHDLAVLPISHQKYYVYLCISTESFLTQDIARRMDVGIGDETFMVGRFVSHDGKQRNCPSVRWGRISMMPGEPLWHPTLASSKQDSFLVEIHSISGYSGSPVFVRPFAEKKLHYEPKLNTVVYTSSVNPPWHEPIKTEGPWLLGVEWGYINAHDQWKNNTGVSGVVPSWHLLDLLNTEELVRKRKLEQQEFKRQAEENRSILTE